MSHRLVLGDWATQRADAQVVRHEVFVLEQKVPLDMEWDEMDPLCVHAVAYDADGSAVATGRLLPDGHVGRMAVRKAARGQGIGGAILKALIAEAKKRGDHAVMLNAQTHAEPFYQRYGFVRDGDEFMEAGIPHIGMRLVLAT
jgi:predicted GNAT family N-acyltransferase